MSTKRSEVWNYFTKCPDDETKVQCNLCSGILSVTTASTSNMTRHLKLKHPTIKFLNIQKRTLEEDSEEDCPPTKKPEFDENFAANNSGRSIVWEYFKKSLWDDNKVQCYVCLAVLSVKNGSTSNMTRHIKLKHPKLYYSEIHMNEDGSEDDGTPMEQEEYETFIENTEGRSTIWKYFTKSTMDDSRVKCSLCSAILSIKSGSNSNMTRHLKVQHIAIYLSETRMVDEEIEDDNTLIRNVNYTETFIENSGARSNVWNYFTKGTMDETKVKCNLCSSVLSIKNSSMSNMARHLRLKHCKVYLELKCAETLVEDSGLRSVVWNHFTKCRWDETKVKCNLCSAVLSVKSASTSSMAKHLRIKHPTIMENPKHMFPEDSEDDNIQLNEDDGIQVKLEVFNDDFPEETKDFHPDNDNALNSTTIASFDTDPLDFSKQDSIDKQLLNFVVSDYQSLNIVDSNNFKKFVCLLNPDYQLPNKKTISNSFSVAYENCLTKVKTEIGKAAYVAISIDGWNSINNERFFAITGHFVDENCALQSRMLSTFKLLELTSENMVEQLKLVLSEWHLDDKVVACVTNNQAVQLGKWCHVPCFAHSLNLVVQAGLCEIVSTLKKVRSVVEDFKITEECLNMDAGDLTLRLDHQTRWNSTYVMLDRINRNKEFFKDILETINDPSIPVLYPEDWYIVDKSCDILAIFNEIATEIGSEKHVTLSKIAVLTNTLISYSNRLKEEEFESPLVKNMVEKLDEEIMARFKTNANIIWEATFLDPRFRQYGFHDENILKEIKENIVNECVKIRDKETNQKPDETKEPTASTSSASSTNQKSKSIWSFFDSAVEKFVERGENSRTASIIEVDKYCQMPLLSRASDPLVWWKENKQVFPSLFEIMKKRLCISATAVPCEWAFSKKGQIVAEKRSLVHSDKIAKLMFLNRNFECLEF